MFKWRKAPAGASSTATNASIMSKIGLTTQLQQLQRTSVKSTNVWEVIYSKHDSLFADKVMSEADWIRHRRATLRHRLEPMDLMKVMIGYMPLLVWVALLSVAIGLYDITLVKWYAWPMLSAECVETFFSSITVALTLLLVFKTNSCYDRWWEARKNVGKLTSWAHNFTRQAVAYFPPDEPQLVQALGRWTAASLWAVKSLVRQDSCLRQELRGVLLPEELSWLVAQRHKPLALVQALSTIVESAGLHPMIKHAMDGQLTLYTYEFGACNRTYNTAIPTAYTRHTSRFLLCYILVGLPLLLWPMAGWASPVLAVVIAFLLLGVENIAAYIEEPFYAIAFDSFAGAVQRDVLTIVAMWAGSSADRTGLTDPLNPAAAEGGRATNAPVVAGVTSPLLPQLACGPPGAAAPSDGAATGEGPDGDGDDDDDGDDCEFVDGGSVDDGDDGSATVAGGGGGSSSGSSSSSSPDPLGASKAAAAAAAAKVSAEIQHQRGAGAAGSAGSGSSSGSSSAAMHRVSSTDDVRPPPRHGGGSAARHRLALPAHLGSSVLGAACGGGSASASEQQQRDQVVHHPTPPAANSSSTGSPRHSSLQRGHHHQQQQQQQQQQGGVQRTAAAPGDCRVTIVP